MNIEKRKEYIKKYQEKNRIRIRERERINYAKNRDKIRARKIKKEKEFRDNNKEKIQKNNKEYRKNNKDKLNKIMKDWANNNAESIRGYALKRKYNISIEEYNKMFEEQKGCCAICGIHQSNFKKALHVDHCHATGKIRKLLCIRCNNALGFLDDNIDKLKRCIEYLETN